MSALWPPLDTHAHVDVSIEPTELLQLRAVVFASNRSLEESRRALLRSPPDLLTVWGVGVHPGVGEALAEYDEDTFNELLGQTAYVGEIGLDGTARDSMPQQQRVFHSIVSQLRERPRLTSIHSAGATREVLTVLEETPIKGAILHWWLGSEELTARAVATDAYFSVNASSVRRRDILALIPVDRLLFETDHPDGNRASRKPKRPGNISDVESALAKYHAVDPSDLRRIVWRNLATLVDATNTQTMLPARIGGILDATRSH
jgi:TatD DNase family protein